MGAAGREMEDMREGVVDPGARHKAVQKCEDDVQPGRGGWSAEVSEEEGCEREENVSSY